MIDKELFNWSKVFYVNVDEIKYLSTDKIYLHKDWGKDWGSIWDKDFPKIPFNRNNFLIKSLKEFLFNKTPIENTSEYATSKYQDAIKEIKAGHNIYFKTEEQFKERLEYKWNSVYDSMKLRGAKTQDDLLIIDKLLVGQKDASDAIAVVIDKDGQMLLFNGHHRLSCAVLLGIKTLPVRVAIRHKQWVDFLIWVKSFNKSQWRDVNKTYQPMNHVDFRDFQPEWSDYRFNKIKENITTKGSILDVGALWGEFCIKFEKEGYECTAVELNQSMIKVMDKMRIANECEFEIKHGDLFDLGHYNYDIVLALNIWHHFIKTEVGYNKLKLLLSKLTCKELFFQAHSIKEGQMQGIYKNYTPEEFVDFILVNCPNLNNYKQIGEERNRKLFKLWT